MAAAPPSPDGRRMPKPILEYMINHVFLPPQLPQEDDYSLENESWLLACALNALEDLGPILQENQADARKLIAIQGANDMLHKLYDIYYDNGTSTFEGLCDSLKSLAEDVNAVPIPVYLHAQNAGILISSVVEDDRDDVYFELFELSPLNHDAVSITGRLQRTFPGCAVAIPRKELKTPAFLRTVTDTLTKMSQQPASGTTQKVKKAGEMHQEDRETTHPKMATELFAAYLRSVGRMVQVSSILKNTRQDVLWKDSRSPWRRSALWLLVRVALQLFFSRYKSESERENMYKSYMLLFMAYTLQEAEAEEYDISADLMWSMKAKLTRRRLKLANYGNSVVLQFVDGVLSKAAASLEKRWSRIQKRDSVRHDFSDLKALPAAQDTILHLERLDRYIEAISRREDRIQPAEVRESCPLPEFTSPLNTSFDEFPITTPTILKLLKFESWVELSLDWWLVVNIDKEEICKELRFVIESYHRCAVAQYQHNPEAMSLMFLTILELWVALDKSTIRFCHLLDDYGPPFGEKILRSLILPERRQMERLQAIEHYLHDRSSQAEFPANYIFQDFGRDDSFAVRYFDQSTKHINTWNDIQGRATAAAEQKRVELKEKRDEYEQYIEEYNRLEHEYTRSFNHQSRQHEEWHDDSCVKCRHQNEMNSLKIEVHEWPLPEDYNEAKTVVFELRVPPSFGSWRDATVFMLTDVLGFGYASGDQPRAFYTVANVEGLKSFREYDATRRVSLLSEEKPHSRTHRNVKSIITTSDEEVFVSHGARFRYYDSGRKCFVGAFAPTDYFTHACTFQLSISSRQMQQFLDNTIDPIRFSNTIIATQSQCPRMLSLEEYKGMASIRAGSNTRWQNILKELALPSVNFGKEDTALIILQCIHQAGKPSVSNVLRETHAILADQRFCITLLGKLLDACERVSGNWQSAPALSAFISITSRVLSLSSAVAIQQSALEILSRAREISLEWVNILKQKAQGATEDRVRENLLSQAVFVALICADSFNMNSRNMREVLSIPEEAATLIQVTILIQECRYKIPIGTSPLAPLLYHRWKRLCFNSFPILAERVAFNQSPALDMAIQRSWATYQPVGPWYALQAPYNHWFTSTLAPGGSGNISVVQFSMLTGELLVNGLPLNRLPEEYEKSSAYQTLFGNATIEAMPSSVIGMRFSGKQMFAEHELHFNFGTEQDTLPKACLLIQASNRDTTLELISPSLFCNQLPEAFLDEFVHWYNVTEDYIEFRPRNLAWSYSNTNWKLYRVGGGNAWQLSRAERYLVNIQSSTAARFSSVFRALEEARYIHVMFDRDASLLEIELPRIQLGFSATLDGASIKSHQHRGMSIHENQTIGALVGLKNKLVLKSDKANSREKIVVPNGNISYSSNGHHVRVTIDKHSSTKTHVYEIDRQLGRIIDNGTLTSKLVLAYIHGLTSFCLPDPLTGSTGTNAALTILRSAAVRSFPTASQADIELLVKIAKLTPGREYYPKNLQVMETVHWSPGLGFLAQHSEYYESVKSLFEHFKRSNLFQSQSPVEIPALHAVDEALLRREKLRSSVVRVWDFGAQHYTRIYDRAYSARDRSQNSHQSTRALLLSQMVFRGKANQQFLAKGDIGRDLWNFLLCNCDVLKSGPCSPGIFQYDARFLADTPKIIAKELLIRLKALKSPKSQPDKYQIMIWLATVAFAEYTDMGVLQILASFYICTEMNTIPIPDTRRFDLRRGLRPLEDLIKAAVDKGRKHIKNTPDARYQNESNSHHRRRTAGFKNRVDATVSGFIKELIKQWPCANPQVFSHVEWEAYIDVNKVMPSVRELFQQSCDNYSLLQYLKQLGKATPRNSAPLNAPVYMPSAPVASIYAEMVDWHVRGFITTDIVFSGPAPLHIIGHGTDTLDIKSIIGRQRDISLLPDLLARLDQITDSPFEGAYMGNLRKSLVALSGFAYGREIESSPDHLQSILMQQRNKLEQAVRQVYSAMVDSATEPIREKLRAQDENGKSDLPSLQHFQKLCPLFFLRHLSWKRWASVPRDWKRCIVYYGVVFTQLQRADRLLNASKNPASLMRELNNSGHENWDPHQYPESLLLEIENGILIRDTQEQIAAQMRNPPSRHNAVMQLNMGEGKSSVIVPIVAASLADTTRLVRVIVARPQSKQMLQMLVAKLGGLLDRQIYHLPFSRAIKIGDGSAKVVDSLLKECMKSGGILLTQPENILSLMLMGIESRISGNLGTNQTLVKTLGFLDANSRDIVDESDENFSVKFELLYTMGLQQSISYSPGRWICVQDVLEIFRKIAPEIQHELPSSIEIYQQPIGGFPRIRILRADAHSRMLIRIAEEICSKGLKGFPIVRQRKRFRQAVFRYITTVQPSPADINTVEDNSVEGFWAKWRDALLLLRGLLAGGILSFCFGQKRWRVDYGFDANRRPATKLALPFRAKDNPTPRSEFSHPEVVIVLTQLSYYYGGLSNEELESGLKHLLNSDQPEVEFQLWVREVTALSGEFKQVSGINLADRSTCEEKIFPHLRFSKGAIDYFLSNCVFPKEMKEFPHKLSASGWDIGKIKRYPTTGFSGTNDSRAVLPLSVEQLDLDAQKHTNALVLEHLLQPENSVAFMPSRVGQEVSDAEMLLGMVVGMEPPVRVILDVGAQILELDNLGVAEKWLSSVHDSKETEAVVFFGENDELSVLDRKGRIEPLQVSPYINQLEHCLVFLDEAHTRGTDLKLPRHYRAAVTLGANLTKDRLVQACMRMRLLGQGQSVIFCVPEEISSQIRERLPNTQSGQSGEEPAISVSDILAWAITETWNETKRNIPLWAAQGRRHERQKGLWAQCHATEDGLTDELAGQFLEDEAQSLEDRYRPVQAEHKLPIFGDAITRRCQQFNNLKLAAATLQEEQERELAPEIEQERQDERPPLVDPADHTLHKDVEAFVKTGKLVAKSKGYIDAFMSLRQRSAASLFNLSEFRSGLLVSADFARTIKSKVSDKLDGYQRPVQWVLTASQTPNGAVEHMMIISPYEADKLVHKFKKSNCVALHLYAPCSNSAYESLDTLDLYTIPETLKDREIPLRLVTALNLFSGQLYISSYEGYVDTCKFLGLSWEPTRSGEIIEADGFIRRDRAGRVGGESGLSASPVEFFRVLLSKIRRNCEAIDKTHMGQVLDNQLLSPEDFKQGLDELDRVSWGRRTDTFEVVDRKYQNDGHRA
ncbi:hypothetical protein GGR51DRAFT_535017 [Nemania sp. FL0031]|nr:hypothetical protein GGR51DRAFT_535017 [Nemania sp. FL0031]